MRGFWRRLGFLLTGYDAESQRKEFDAVKTAFQALPKPKDEIPPTTHRVTL